MKRHAPATSRNREPLAAVLREELPTHGLILEIASGTGEHAAYFARAFPDLEWQPSDCDPDALASIAAWRAEELVGREDAGRNLRPPLRLNVCAEPWPVIQAQAIMCINMVHISPPEAAAGLMQGAGKILRSGAPLIVYGPFLEENTVVAPSNLAFDQSLRTRDPRWGLRHAGWLDGLASAAGLGRTRRVEMPANNLALIYRRSA